MLDRQSGEMRIVHKAGANTMPDQQSPDDFRVALGWLWNPNRLAVKPVSYLPPRLLRR